MSFRHRILMFSCRVFLSVFLVACARASGPLSLQGPEDATPPVGTPCSHLDGRGAIPRALAMTRDGAIALIDGSSGARLATSTPTKGTVRSLAFDPLAGLVLQAVFDDIDAGEQVGYPFGPAGQAGFGDPIGLGWINGDLRWLSTPMGVVTFAQSYASSSWSWSTSTSNASAPLPPPVSAWTHNGGAAPLVRIESLTLGALDAPVPMATRQAAWAGNGGVAAEAPVPLTVTLEDPTSARLLPTPATGDATLVDVEGGRVVVRRVDGASVEGPWVVPGPLAATRIEAMVALADGRVLVAATQGPARLVAIQLDDNGKAVSSAALDLAGGFAVADRFFSSDLLALNAERILVATGSGVLAVNVVTNGNPVALAVDPGFDGGQLQGPLAPPPLIAFP